MREKEKGEKMLMGEKFFQWFQKDSKKKENPIGEMEHYIMEVENQISSIQGKIQSQLLEGKRLKGILDEYHIEIQKLEKYEKVAKERQDLQGLMLYQSKKEEFIQLEHQKVGEYEKITIEIEENQKLLEQINDKIKQLKIVKDTLENTILNE